MPRRRLRGSRVTLAQSSDGWVSTEDERHLPTFRKAITDRRHRAGVAARSTPATSPGEEAVGDLKQVTDPLPVARSCTIRECSGPYARKAFCLSPSGTRPRQPIQATGRRTPRTRPRIGSRPHRGHSGSWTVPGFGCHAASRTLPRFVARSLARECSRGSVVPRLPSLPSSTIS